ncbi:hypothetical protein [Flavilitoribacter nigricans]|uniref:Uncharacterized protein n=1 Tax=Flavilitoribacter nigricans (strain ATCC 23147 / DSM 23189 / NBRC 102662 / NCIMB 1420 / SS-2) TaxID=1122177 RepID=A0A2D0MZU6_FLAN2|nr:hypothetical protein [Flavilitoribacter nigricans]PHN01700.1 hypothetical protein CRP01_35730 [Flavilitoribacter nigricans DSM 23189 = NBRC 102662]
MKITDNKRLIQVQEEFQEDFPFLKIEFYAGQHQAGEGSRAEEKLDPQLTIGEVRSKHREGDLQIDGELEVRQLEKLFFDDYGLNVQVFRQSGHLWMQTSASDHWTLEKQNRKGGHSAAIVNDQA